MDAFDAEAFAERMARTGAGFVVFTTSHAEQMFPAPLASLDAVLRVAPPVATWWPTSPPRSNAAACA
ncbi:MAG: hypothetical protein U1G05_19190 [Kiritimatiellia bacterium]